MACGCRVSWCLVRSSNGTTVVIPEGLRTLQFAHSTPLSIVLTHRHIKTKRLATQHIRNKNISRAITTILQDVKGLQLRIHLRNAAFGKDEITDSIVARDAILLLYASQSEL